MKLLGSLGKKKSVAETAVKIEKKKWDHKEDKQLAGLEQGEVEKGDTVVPCL